MFPVLVDVRGADIKPVETGVVTKATAPLAKGIPNAPPSGKLRHLPLAFWQDQPASVSDLRVMEQHVAALVSSVSGAVVTVQAGMSSGSGVVVSPDGLVLTVAHVCRRPGRDVVFIFPDGRKVKGKTLGMNHEMDSALAKITEPGPWPCVSPGNLVQSRLGEWVLALGHPGGFDAQRPVVARLGRIIQIAEDGVQTDCTLMAGDSGGPLFDMHGRVVAIHSRISDSTAENFHVPINTYFDTWARLATSENWGEQPASAIAWLGTHGIDHAEGCQIEFVDETGPAFKAGIRTGDIVLKINDQEIKNSNDYGGFVRRRKPGDQLSLELLRDGKILSFKVTVEARRRQG